MKWIVVTEVNSPWVEWAGEKQFQLWPFAGLVKINNAASVDTSADQIEKAARLAGAGGVVLLSVGHGGLGDGGSGAPFFDMGPMNGNAPTFRVAGANVKLTGTGPPSDVSQVDVFYDRVPVFGGGAKGKSKKQEDEQRAQSSDPSISGPAKTRLAHWERYLGVGRALQANGVGAIILLTCKIGLANDFLLRVRQQLQVPIGAYKRRVKGAMIDYTENGRVTSRGRMWLEGDKDGQGTNIEMGDFWIPMPPLRDWTVIP